MNKALQQAAAALGNVVKTPPKPIEEPDVVFMISARLMRAPVVFEFKVGRSFNFEDATDAVPTEKEAARAPSANSPLQKSHDANNSTAEKPVCYTVFPYVSKN